MLHTHRYESTKDRAFVTAEETNDHQQRTIIHSVGPNTNKQIVLPLFSIILSLLRVRRRYVPAVGCCGSLKQREVRRNLEPES